MKAKHKKHVKTEKPDKRWLTKLTNENHLLIISFLILLIALVVINSIYAVVQSNQSAATLSIDSQLDYSQVLTSMQAGVSGAVKAQVSNVTENSNTDYAFGIDPSDTMLILTLVITNRTSGTQQFFPDNQLFVRTSDGSYSALHASMYVTNPIQATELKPGQSVSGQVSFAVSKQADRPLLYIDTGWDNYAPLVFDVLH